MNYQRNACVDSGVPLNHSQGNKTPQNPKKELYDTIKQYASDHVVVYDVPNNCEQVGYIGEQR